MEDLIQVLIVLFWLVVSGIVLYVVYLIVAVFIAQFYRNDTIKRFVPAEADEETCNILQRELFELIQINTHVFENEDNFHTFREKLKELFPLVHEHFKREKIQGNVILSYKTPQVISENVLFVTHIDYDNFQNYAKIEQDEVYGNGAFDSKALLYIMLKAVEEKLSANIDLGMNLTIVITMDDTSTKEGSSLIVNKFLREGKFFRLVLEEGTGIVDPEYLGLNSSFALIGIGVTGEVKMRFFTQNTQNGLDRLERFLYDMKFDKVFKTSIDKPTLKMLRAMAKDMPFRERFMILNPWIFKSKIKRMLDGDMMKFAKILKTSIHFGEIQTQENQHSVDLTFSLANHDTPSELLTLIFPYIDRYKIEYKVQHIKSGTKITDTDIEGYKKVEKTIHNVFENVYTSPFIITRITEKRFFDQVSDCVIHFSPLYYSIQSLRDAFLNQKEHVSKQSLYHGVNFFKELMNQYTGKGENNGK